MFSDFVTNYDFQTLTQTMSSSKHSHTLRCLFHTLSQTMFYSLCQKQCVFSDVATNYVFQTLAQTCFSVGVTTVICSSDFGTHMCSDFVTDYVRVSEFDTNTMFSFSRCHKLVFLFQTLSQTMSSVCVCF